MFDIKEELKKLPDSPGVYIMRDMSDNIIYVGDTNGDYLATKKAGGTFIHAAYGFGEIEDETAKIDDITQLPELLKKMEGAYPAQ